MYKRDVRVSNLVETIDITSCCVVSIVSCLMGRRTTPGFIDNVTIFTFYVRVLPKCRRTINWAGCKNAERNGSHGHCKHCEIEFGASGAGQNVSR